MFRIYLREHKDCYAFKFSWTGSSSNLQCLCVRQQLRCRHFRRSGQAIRSILHTKFNIWESRILAVTTATTGACRRFCYKAKEPGKIMWVRRSARNHDERQSFLDAQTDHSLKRSFEKTTSLLDQHYQYAEHQKLLKHRRRSSQAIIQQRW